MVNANTYVESKNRMNRIINPKDNRVVMLAIDHPYFQGPTTGPPHHGYHHNNTPSPIAIA